MSGFWGWGLDVRDDIRVWNCGFSSTGVGVGGKRKYPMAWPGYRFRVGRDMLRSERARARDIFVGKWR